MALADTYNLSTNAAFSQRVQAAIVHWALAITSEITNNAQTITTTGTVTGGTFTLTLLGQTTTPILWNSGSGGVQSALAALSTVGVGNVVCTGGPLPATGVVCTFIGLLAGQSLPLITHTDTLTGTTPAVSVAITTVGTFVVNHLKNSVLANKVLNNPSFYASLISMGVADNSTVQADFPPPTYVQSGGVTTATADSDIQFTVNSIMPAYA